ncbi:MAG: hypothetical protein QW548_01100 [Candidatus Aenigmatarchaeota archaeon]
MTMRYLLDKKDGEYILRRARPSSECNEGADPYFSDGRHFRSLRSACSRLESLGLDDCVEFSSTVPTDEFARLWEAYAKRRVLSQRRGKTATSCCDGQGNSPPMIFA